MSDNRPPPIAKPGEGSGRSLKMPSLKKESPPPQPKEDVTSPRSPVGTRHNWEKPKRKIHRYTQEQLLALHRPTKMPLEVIEGVTTKDSLSCALEESFTMAEVELIWEQSQNAARPMLRPRPRPEDAPPRFGRGTTSHAPRPVRGRSRPFPWREDADNEANDSFRPRPGGMGSWRTGESQREGFVLSKGRVYQAGSRRYDSHSHESNEETEMTSKDEETFGDLAGFESDDDATGSLKELAAQAAEFEAMKNNMKQGSSSTPVVEESFEDKTARAKNTTAGRAILAALGLDESEDPSSTSDDAPRKETQPTSAEASAMLKGMLGLSQPAPTPITPAQSPLPPTPQAVQQAPPVPHDHHLAAEREREMKRRHIAELQARRFMAGVPWFYEDPQRRIQGGYASEKMQHWLSRGFFDKSLPVRLGETGSFTPLGQLYPDLQLAFVHPPPALVEKIYRDLPSDVPSPSPSGPPAGAAGNPQAAIQDQMVLLRNEAEKQMRMLETRLAEKKQADQQAREVCMQIEQGLQAVSKSGRQLTQAQMEETRRTYAQYHQAIDAIAEEIKQLLMERQRILHHYRLRQAQLEEQLRIAAGSPSVQPPAAGFPPSVAHVEARARALAAAAAAAGSSGPEYPSLAGAGPQPSAQGSASFASGTQHSSQSQMPPKEASSTGSRSADAPSGSQPSGEPPRGWGRGARLTPPAEPSQTQPRPAVSQPSAWGQGPSLAEKLGSGAASDPSQKSSDDAPGFSARDSAGSSATRNEEQSNSKVTTNPSETSRDRKSLLSVAAEQEATRQQLVSGLKPVRQPPVGSEDETHGSGDAGESNRGYSPEWSKPRAPGQESTSPWQTSDKSTSRSLQEILAEEEAQRASSSKPATMASRIAGRGTSPSAETSKVKAKGKVKGTKLVLGASPATTGAQEKSSPKPVSAASSVWGAVPASKAKPLTEVMMEDAKQSTSRGGPVTAASVVSGGESGALNKLGSQLKQMLGVGGGGPAPSAGSTGKAWGKSDANRPKSLQEIQAEQARKDLERATGVAPKAEPQVPAPTKNTQPKARRSPAPSAPTPAPAPAPASGPSGGPSGSAWGSVKRPKMSLKEIQQQEAALAQNQQTGSSGPAPWSKAAKTTARPLGSGAPQQESSKPKSSSGGGGMFWDIGDESPTTSFSIGDTGASDSQVTSKTTTEDSAFPPLSGGSSGGGGGSWTSVGARVPVKSGKAGKSGKSTQKGGSPSSTDKEFGVSMPPAFERWCQQELKKIQSAPKDLTFIHYCLTLDSASEVREVFSATLGSTPAVSNFATDFLQKRSTMKKR